MTEQHTPLSLGNYNEHDRAVHLTGGAMFGKGHIHIAVYGDQETATAAASLIAALFAKSSAAKQHTPGPWHVPTNCPSGVAVGNLLVAVATDANFPTGVCWANARLIAAAPELLGALKAVTAEYRDGYGLHCIEQVREAISKAETK